MMPHTPPTNARGFQENGSIVSNVSRKVTVWGVDPNAPVGAITLCTDATGSLYEVYRGSRIGTVQPQAGETWLISRIMGYWTFVSRIGTPSPRVQVVTYSASGSYEMVSSNRFVFVDVPTNGAFTVKLPPPLDAIDGELYGVRNLNTATSGTSTLTVVPFSSEAIYGATNFGSRTGGSYVTDGTSWYGVAPGSY